jgi:hypothetical protein
MSKMKNTVLKECHKHGKTMHVVDEWVAMTDQDGAPTMWDSDTYCIECQTFERVRDVQNIAAGMWYRCSHNGYEFMAFVTQVDAEKNRIEMQIDDWRNCNMTEWFHVGQVENWYMEYVA